MTRNYKDVRGVVFKKYRNIWGKYILLMDEDGTRTKLYVSKSLYDYIQLGSKWTIGHIAGNIVNIRPGFQEHEDEYC